MQLLNGALRCLQAVHAAKLNATKCLVSTHPATQCLGCVALQQRRHYAEHVPAIAMAHEQFDGPTPDATRQPLITMHGLFGSKQNWRSVSKALAKQTNRRVYTVDLRNHGDSPHTTTHNSFGMTADLLAFTQAKSLSKTSLMGHSMGGRAAMHFALSHPEICERLIVVDVSPVAIPRTVNEMSGIFNAMLDISLPANVAQSKGRQIAKEALLKTVDRDTVDFILLNLRKKPDTGEFYWACNVEVLLKSLHGFSDYGSHIASLPPFTGPTTFICGTQSTFMDPNDWPQILKFFPNATQHWLETGHLVHLEEPHKFIQIVAEFLNKP
ncbi:protein ABHD11 [Drosophila grimshawi]|uniref:sn-1-specific diacylglycerol lipase ABHD11 n=1 Tax=Drosophila grimshawi TaxID=7222 RepID=B4JMV8_DROGR|nr:protein ABHD11 [Drosophila grimshawi]EDV92051.1 GH24258 [Drosophila grimshawi]